MKFCRNCGSALSAGAPVPMQGPPLSSPPTPFGLAPTAPPPGAPSVPGPLPGMPPPGPIGGVPGPITTPGSGPHMGGPISGGPMSGVKPMPGPMGGPIGGPMPQPGPFGSPTPMPPTGPMVPGGGPMPGPLPSVPRPGADLPPTVPPSVPPKSGAGAAAAPDMRTVTCPRCGTPTPMGFAYCQQCGLHMSALQPTDPGAMPSRARTPSSIGKPAPGQPPIDPQAATMAQDGPRANMMIPSGAAQPVAPSKPLAAGSIERPATGPAWGTAVLVNRDGSDGQRFPLAGEYLVVGRAGADIAFDDDRFLARQHARLERAADGSVKIHPLDTLNGVYRKADAPVDLADGMMVLVGREVLRFERVDGEEVKVHPLVRHGVALFGSPPREPWGRLAQIIPSGGIRDIRHLAGEEVVLGREEGDIVFRDDAFMSRRHAAVTWNGKQAQITDLGSSNGTFVRITAPTPLKHGDHVRMGDQLLRIELQR